MSRDWAELWRSLSAETLRLAAEVVTFSDGVQVILPMVAFRQYRGLLQTYQMSAGGAYGAPLSKVPLSVIHHRHLVAHLLSLSAVAWTTSPIHPAAGTYEVPGAEQQQTHILALTGQMTDLLKRWSKGARAAVKQAQRAGVVVRLGSGQSDWRTYFDIYQDSRIRWAERATSDHPWALFAHLSGLDQSRVRLWLAEVDGTAVAGAVCLYGRKHVAYWHGAALASAFESRPVNALMAGAIEHALTSGFEWFDFGMSGGHEGVAAFKRGFGAEPVTCHIVSQTSATANFTKRVLGTLLGA